MDFLSATSLLCHPWDDRDNCSDYEGQKKREEEKRPGLFLHSTHDAERCLWLVLTNLLCRPLPSCLPDSLSRNAAPNDLLSHVLPADEKRVSPRGHCVPHHLRRVSFLGVPAPYTVSTKLTSACLP